MANRKPSTREEIIAEVTRRATLDRDFRERLLKDPREALPEILGQPLPAHIKIRFIEKDPDLDALIVLPDFIPEIEELSDDDLDVVAGGTGDPGDCWMTA